MARAIDADDFIEKLDLLGTHQYVLTKNQVKFLLMEQPTIDPVKRGKWEFGRENGASGYWCSNCKSGFVGENAEWIAKEHNYCPNCGARMDGEANGRT